MAETGQSTAPKLSDLKIDSSATVTITEAPITPPLTLSAKTESLKPLLSSSAAILFPSDSQFHSSTARWSTNNAPKPGAVVNVTSEADIAATVQWAYETNTPILAQSGGHGFTSTLSSLGSNGLLINLRALNKVTIDQDASTATISGGALISEAVSAAHAAGKHIVTGICNGVGAVSPMLGGGMGNMIALYGLAVDNLLSARLITATGQIVNVSKDENAELFWGLRGAGHNFGIVSELTVKAYEQINGGVHWGGTVAFPGTEEHLAAIIPALNSLGFGSGRPLAVDMIWAKIPPLFQPTILLNLWYAGTEDEGKEVFAPILSLGPVFNATGPVPYSEVNAVNDQPCIKNGHRRPCYGAATPSLTVELHSSIFRDWIEFLNSDEDFAPSIVLTELYDWKKARELGGKDGEWNETAYPWRELDVYMNVCPEFSKEELKGKAASYGKAFREKLGAEKNIYVNFAAGDEPLSAVYGDEKRLERLRALKTKWDPTGVFSHYNPIR